MADTVTINNAMIQHALEYSLGASPTTPTLSLHLFANNITPACTDDTTTYTEPVGAGYDSIPLTYSDWVGTTTDCTTTYNYPTQTFTLTADGDTIYGHYYVNDAEGLVWWAVLWQTPYVVPTGGAVIQIIPAAVGLMCPP